MKIVKYFTFLILSLTGFLFMGELSILNIDTFQDNYYCAEFFFTNDAGDVSNDVILTDINLASEKYGVDYFSVEYEWDTSFSYNTIIIGNEAAIKKLREKGIKEGVNDPLT